MGVTTTGLWLNQHLSPQLLQEFRNFKDDFVGVIPGADKRAITADGIRLNKLINNVGFYVDNTTDFTAKKMNGEKTFVPWEKYDTDPTEVDDAEVRALPFDKRGAVRVKHSEAFKIGIRDHIMWKLCPEDNTVAGMPVIRTSGVVANGRKRLKFEDLINYVEMIKALNLPQMDKCFMILNNQHSSDLILDRDSANYFTDKNTFFDPTTGAVKNILSLKFFENNAAPLFDSTDNKKPKGAVALAGDQLASTFFYSPNSVYHLDKTKILYSDEHTDTKSADPKSEFRTQTYGLVDRIVDYGFGAIISANG